MTLGDDPTLKGAQLPFGLCPAPLAQRLQVTLPSRLPQTREVQVVAHYGGESTMRAVIGQKTHTILFLGTVLALGCGGKDVIDDQNADVGAPCIPGDQNRADFRGYSLEHETIEPSNSACAPDHVCLVNHFQGRVGCPRGQSEPKSGRTTEDDSAVSVPVCAQCSKRPAATTVHCSCKCAPPAGVSTVGETFCTCPAGFECAEIRPLLDSQQVSHRLCRWTPQGSAVPSCIG